ncbi:MAG: Gmad2 immunoglobulin-like domain-containing protein [Actinomycetota bacterium]
MMTVRMRRATIACAAALALLGACSNDTETPNQTNETATAETPTPPEEPTDDPTPTQEPSPSDESNTTSFQVWFSDGSRLAPAIATIDATPRVGSAALRLLIEGPAGVGNLNSAVPPSTEVNSLSIERGTATVDLSSEFESGGGVTSAGTRLAQVTFTLTQFPTVKRVAFLLDGERPEIFSEAGLVFQRSFTRADFEDFSPAIIVNRPLGETEAHSPVTVAGTANVFEANVLIRIVGEGGEVLAETFTTATCGTGCRGDFSKDVEFDVEEPTEATLQVYEESAETGRRMNMIEVPITLVP